jgi:hypothetical protein
MDEIPKRDFLDGALVGAYIYIYIYIYIDQKDLKGFKRI